MRRTDEIKNIVKKTKRYKYTIYNNELLIQIEDALFGEVNGLEEMLDKRIVDSYADAIVNATKKYASSYNPIPKCITISRSSEVKKPEIIPDIDKSLLKLQSPLWKLDDVHIEQDCKNQILTALTVIQNKEKIYSEWGLGKVFKNHRSVVLNFYGASGTGKSMAAEAIAEYLGKEMLAVNYSELESKYVGETPKNITEVFRHATKSGSVIIFDEADSFLGKRLRNVSQSADYGVNVTRSVMLMEIERFEGVIIFTTNMIENYDEAFKRRILANIEFNMPNADVRKQIWNTHIPAELPLASDVSPDVLAESYTDISGADIKDMVLYASVDCISKSNTVVSLSSFDKAYRYIRKRYNYNPIQTVDAEIIDSKDISREEYEKEIGGVDE